MKRIGIASATWMASCLLTLLSGCSSPSADAPAATQNATVVNPADNPLMSLVPGSYGDMTLARDKRTGVLTGHFATTVGDPNRGGAECEFYFVTSGDLHTAKGPFSVVWFHSEDEQAHHGTMSFATDKAFTLELDVVPDGFDRVAAGLGDPTKGIEFTLEKDGTDDPAYENGFRRVAADKAYFNDDPGGPKRSAYVVKGQFLQVKDARNGFVLGTFDPLFGNKTTSGWISEDDLVPPLGPKSDLSK